jgi:hypothetical protein
MLKLRNKFRFDLYVLHFVGKDTTEISVQYVLFSITVSNKSD